MNKKKTAVYMFICILLFTGCSAKMSSDNAVLEEAAYEDVATQAPIESERAANITEETKPSEKKIIKSADVFIEANNANDTYEKLYERLIQLDGYEFSRNSGQNNNTVSINLTLKIPAQSLDTFLSFLKECGDIKNMNVSARDITDQYYDIQLRLENMKRSLAKYYEFLHNAQNVEDMLKVQSEINNLTAEIESAEGRINLWNKQTAESDITITIREKNDPARYSGRVKWNSLSFNDMGNIIKVGFVSVSGTVVSIIQWLIIITISCLPIIIIAAAIVFLLIYLKKQKNKKK